MPIETTYKNYQLRMNEHDETWSCFELEITDCKSLRACKDAIDKLSQKDRRIDIKALMLMGGGGRFRDIATVVEVSVNLLCAPVKGYGSKQEEVKQCWITTPKGERSKISIESLYPLDARGELNGWLALEAKAEETQKLADAAKEEIECHSPDTLVLASKEARAAEKKEPAA